MDEWLCMRFDCEGLICDLDSCDPEIDCPYRKALNKAEKWDKAVGKLDTDAFQIMSAKIYEELTEKAEKWSKVPEKVYSTPLTWWDHFKLRWFPDWLEKYFPIKWKEIPVFEFYDRLEGVREDLVNLSRTYDPSKTTWKYIELWCELNRRLGKHFGTDWM